MMSRNSRLMAVTSTLLAILILQLAIVYGNPSNNSVQITKEVYIKEGYIEIISHISAPSDLALLKFNLSRAKNMLLLAYAELGEEKYSAIVSGSTLTFKWGKPATNITLVEIYVNTMTYSEKSINVTIPLLLSPEGFSANTTVYIKAPTTRIQPITRFQYNVSRDRIYFNVEVEPANYTELDLLMSPYTPLLKIENLHRTVIIKENSKALFIDNITLVNIGGGKPTFVSFTLPQFSKLEEVEGPLGVYPNIGTFKPTTAQTSDGKTKVTIKLRAPPQNHGDKTLLTLIYSVNLTATEGEIPAFNPLGKLIQNYTILFKVKGEVLDLSCKTVKTYKENSYTVVEVASVGPLYDEIHSTVAGAFKVNQPLPTPIIVAFAIVIAAAFIAVYYLRRKPKVKVEERKKKVAEKAEKVALSEILSLAREKVGLLEEAAEVWSRYLEGKMSWQNYRQQIASIMKREAVISKKLKDVTKDAKEEVKEILADIDEQVGYAKNILKRMERVERNFKRGILSKNEYKEQAEKLRGSLEKTISQIHKLIVKLEEYLP